MIILETKTLKNVPVRERCIRCSHETFLTVEWKLRSVRVLRNIAW